MTNDWKVWMILGVTLAAVVATSFLPRIPQDPGYHEFADRRAFMGVPNFGDVISSLAFVIAGAFGLTKYELAKTAGLNPSYVVYCAGIIGVGLGSATYHLDPSSATLLWDRLPMSIGFMAISAMVIGDRISPTVGRRMLWPLVLVGVASVLYWHHTELLGQGDLRPYALVQFLPIVLVVIMLCVYRSGRLRSVCLWGSIGMYVLAKLAEHWDRWLFDLLRVTSGHTVKHLLAFIGAWLVVAALRDCRPLDDSSNDY